MLRKRVVQTPIARGQAVYNPETYVASSLLTSLTQLNLLTNLKLALDAGDSVSYTSGQKWLDLAGGGYDFFLGADVTVTTDDPTFNGVAGTLSSAEFWSFDAGDMFRYDTTNETWMQNLHKDNALFTLAFWLYPAGGAANFMLGNDANTTTNVGLVFQCNGSNGFVTLNVHNGTGSVAFQKIVAPIAVVDGAWQFIAVSVNEAGTMFIQVNAVASAPVTAAYTSPSAASATSTLELGASGGAAGKLPNGARMGMAMAWESRALTQFELEQVYNKTRRRYGV